MTFNGDRTLPCPVKGTTVFRKVCLKKCEYTQGWCKFSPREEPDRDEPEEGWDD